MKQYREKIGKMTTAELQEEWEKTRRAVNSHAKRYYPTPKVVKKGEY
jgi:hypothetical protein